MKYRSLSKPIGILGAFFVSLSLLATLAVYNSSQVHAAPITDFTAGDIIDDSIFYNKDAMSVAQIQAFLDALIPNCDVWGTQPSGYGNLTDAQYAQQIQGWPGPPYVCINKYYENPDTGDTSYEKGGGAFDGGLSAAQIIYSAAQTYNINPQVLLVMLKKESVGPLTSDSWPLKSQYKYAMGYACPDSGPNYSASCDASKAGFYKQMMLAAWQLNYYKQHPNDYRYYLGANNIQYSTDPNCGTKNVYIENMATLSLYIYTPYTPNDAALAAYPGTASCGSYGNRNFFAYFKEWFGDPRLAITGVMSAPYNANTWLGKPLINQVCGLRNSGCYQVFTNGTIYWTSATGAQIIRGGIRDKWISLGFENGTYGYPTTGEQAESDGGAYQTFEGGVINWTNGAGAHGFTSAIFAKWNDLGGEKGILGKPMSDSLCGLKNGGCYQVFTNGTIYWTTDTNTQVVRGGIRDKWISLGSENGALGYPTSGEQATSDGGVFQTFQNGTIYWSTSTAGVSFNNTLYTYWIANGATPGVLGKPMSDSLCGLKNGGCYQVFTNGTIYWTTDTNTQVVRGGIRDKWISLGSENGALGYPTSGEQATSDGGVFQTFQNGTIYWSTSTAGVSFNNTLYTYWIANGATPGVLGKPMSDSLCGLKNGGCYQVFTNGTIYWTTDTNTQVVRGGIRDKWISLGSENGALGYPTSNEQSTSDGGVYQTFQGGTIYWSASSGAIEFNTNLYSAWMSNGGNKGFLGKPTTDSLCGLKNSGCYQVFTNGTIYWTSATGAQIIRGGIRDKWISLGFENGTLSYPTSGEITGGNGVYQSFQGGKIYWSISAGAWKFDNNIYTLWAAYGAENGLGKPLTDSICTLKDSGCYQIFTQGSIYWTSTTGAQVVRGGIRDKWQTVGLENGALGYPTSGEIVSGNGVYQTFQGGTINWTAAAGASVVYN